MTVTLNYHVSPTSKSLERLGENIYVYIITYIYMYIYICICIYMYICVHIYIYIYVYIYTFFIWFDWVQIHESKFSLYFHLSEQHQIQSLPKNAHDTPN